MFAKILELRVDLACLFLRWGLASIFIVHGYFKVVQDVPLMPELSMTNQLLLGWAELGCGVALAVGLLSRIAALTLIPLQVGAIVFFTGKYALRGMSFTATGADFTQVGPEFNVVLITVCLGVFLLGSGTVSLDHFLLTLWRRQKSSPAPLASSASTKGSAAPVVAASTQP